MSKVRCLECRHINLRAYPKMANEGFGRCTLNSQVGEFVSYLYLRDCKDYVRADEAVITERLAWQEKLKEKLKVRDPK